MRGIPIDHRYPQAGLYGGRPDGLFRRLHPDGGHPLPHRAGAKPAAPGIRISERAIAGERVRLAMGLSLQPVQQRTLLSEGMDQAAIAEQYYEPPLVNIIPYACHGCPTHRYFATGLCQGCLAASCQRVCPKGAIKFVNGRSRITESHMHQVRQVRRRLPVSCHRASRTPLSGSLRHGRHRRGRIRQGADRL